jgi:hypothetical protein
VPEVCQDKRFDRHLVGGAQFVLVPAGAETHGHFTHLRAAIWKPYLAAFMKELD